MMGVFVASVVRGVANRDATLNDHELDRTKDQTAQDVAEEQENRPSSAWRTKLWWVPYVISVCVFLVLLYVVTLVESKNRVTQGIVIVAIDLYLLGLFLQLLGFFSVADLIESLLSRVERLETSIGIP
jgi:sterol desaturase/sphingolipid hydroxylase (fatty acid hydroxylase superfamily)